MIKRLCVFCGSKSGKGFSQMATDFGKILSSKKIDLVYGGGGIGLMGILADSVLQGGGNVIGVIPKDLFPDEVEHKKLTQLIKVENMHERKRKMYDLSDGFAALPGGFGTLDEFFEILTWRQLKLHPKPVFLFNFENYYGLLIEYFKNAHKQGLISVKDLSLFKIINDLKEWPEQF
jgi:uncharacterized protein (TIGR00730 family)